MSGSNSIVPGVEDAGVITPRISGPMTATQRIDEAQTLLAAIGPSVKAQYMIDIQGRQYLQVAGAASLGFALGYTTRIAHCDRALTGDGLPHWVATAEVIDTATGEIVGRGTAHVFDDESPWGKRPQFARAAMCQTRAQGRALKGVVGWLFGMLGAEGSLHEEMPSESLQRQQLPAPRSTPVQQPASVPQAATQPVQQWGASAAQASQPVAQAAPAPPQQPAGNTVEIVPSFLDEYKMKNAEATPFWRVKTRDDQVFMVWDRGVRDAIAAMLKQPVHVEWQPAKKEGQNPSIVGVVSGDPGVQPAFDDGIPF
jgi:hypothetical protein